jgi:hypothetical protein
MFAVGNSNGLLSSSATHPGPQTLPAYYIEREENLTVNGNLSVGKDISANGDIYTDTIKVDNITTLTDTSGVPIYIRNPKNIGLIPISNSAVIIEGGADREGISGDRLAPVALTLFKPFVGGISGENDLVGAINFAGLNDNPTTEIVRYASIRAVCTDPTNNFHRSRLDFAVLENNTHNVRMRIDSSNNTISTVNNSRFNDRGYNMYPTALKICEAGVITKQTDITAVPESEFTIPENLGGYYSYSAYIFLAGVGDVSGANDYIDTTFSKNGDSFLGSQGIITSVVKSDANAVRISLGGIFPVRFNPGDVLLMFHRESPEVGFTFDIGSIQVVYQYLGDNVL